jgi:hypothetical protein
MRKYILPLLIILFFSTCKKKDMEPNNTSDGILKTGNQVTICHQSGDNWNVININMSSWPAHEAHGDAIDMDDDGYFDRECGCSEVDCDDNDPNIHSDCDSQPEGLITIEFEGSTIYIQATNNSPGQWNDAVKTCNDLVNAGFEDWYLPSKEELNAMYTELNAGVMDGTYWSSTSEGVFDAWYQDFNTGAQSLGFVGNTMQCRCIRK